MYLFTLFHLVSHWLALKRLILVLSV